MRLTVAMLADSAQVAGGKLYVLGGAFDTVNARAFPALVRSLAVVLVAEVQHRPRQIPRNHGPFASWPISVFGGVSAFPA